MSRVFYTFNEVATTLGGEETLRQILLLNQVRSFVELTECSAMLWGHEDDKPPKLDKSLYSSWSSAGSEPDEENAYHYTLNGWFFVPFHIVRHLARAQTIKWPIQVWPEHDHFPIFEFEIASYSVPNIQSLWFLASDVESLRRGVAVSGNPFGDDRASLIGSEEQPAAGSQKPLQTRERNNLLKIIAGLSHEAKIDLTEGSGGAVQIEAAVAAVGFEGPKEKTIRDILKQVRQID